MHRPHRPLLMAALALACSTVSLFGAASSMAVFTDAAADGGNTLAAGYWTSFYLHNYPTPPTGDTTAQANLAATLTASTQATLYNYDTNCDNRSGRLLTRLNPPTPGNTTNCRYVNWRLPVLAATLTLPAGSTVIVDVWSATQTNRANRTGSIIAYLRDYDPGTGAYVEIASATYTGTYAAGRTFYERPITIPIGGARTLAVGHQLEIKLESPSATSQHDMMVAYDTTGYPSFLSLP